MQRKQPSSSSTSIVKRKLFSEDNALFFDFEEAQNIPTHANLFGIPANASTLDVFNALTSGKKPQKTDLVTPFNTPENSPKKHVTATPFNTPDSSPQKPVNQTPANTPTGSPQKLFAMGTPANTPAGSPQKHSTPIYFI